MLPWCWGDTVHGAQQCFKLGVSEGAHISIYHTLWLNKQKHQEAKRKLTEFSHRQTQSFSKFLPFSWLSFSRENSPVTGFKKKCNSNSITSPKSPLPEKWFHLCTWLLTDSQDQLRSPEEFAIFASALASINLSHGKLPSERQNNLNWRILGPEKASGFPHVLSHP